MPTLPFALPAPVESGDLPVRTSADALPLFPPSVRTGRDAPVRDALLAGITGMHLAHQVEASTSAKRADPTRADDVSLDGHGEDRGVHRSAVEDDETYRERIFASPRLVTLNAIVAVANAILAPFTSKSVQLFEGLDRLFIGAGSRAYAFLAGVDPNYPDRLYVARATKSPEGSWCFADSTNGRFFVLRMPVIAGRDPTTVGTGVTSGAFIGTGAHSNVASFIASAGATAPDIYQQVASAVDEIVGQGVRWQLLEDPEI